MEDTVHNPEIICPFIRAAVKEGKLNLDSEQRVKTSQLRGLVQRLSMPTLLTHFTSAAAIFLANRLRDIPGNLLHRKFSPYEMHRGTIKHKWTTEILTKNGNGKFNQELFDHWISFSKNQTRFTEQDLKDYNHARSVDQSSFGGFLNRLEFNLLLDYCGQYDQSTNTRYIPIDDLTAFYRDARLPERKFSHVTGYVIRQQPGRERRIGGLIVELWQKRAFGDALLSHCQTDDDGNFDLPVIIPPKGLRLKLKFVDPRPSMHRDKVFYERDDLGRLRGDKDLDVVDVPHWLYDEEHPFPVAAVNPYNDTVPQRFSEKMAKLFTISALTRTLKKLFIQYILSRFISLKFLHKLYLADREQQNLQEEDSDAYFMYRMLNGFNPSTIYRNNLPDSKFPAATYFIDCNFEGFESDGKHNLVSGQLYFDIQNYQSTPTPHGIYLRIRSATDTAPYSEPMSERTVPCDDTTEWRLAKQTFRSAWATAGEIDAHLGTGHLNAGQYAIAAYRNFFASPLRQLLLPALKGVTEINELGSDSIFGKKGVLSTNSALSPNALLARLGNHLGTLDWHGWQPPKPLYSTHTYPLVANLFWEVVENLVDEYFNKHSVEIQKHWSETHNFSVDLVQQSVPYFEENDFTVVDEAHARIAPLPTKRSVGLREAQNRYHQHEGLGNYRLQGQMQDKNTQHLSVTKIQDLDDIKHCSKYILFHATFWHWWSNDLQSTDLSNIFYTSLGLRNGIREFQGASLPSVKESAEQLTFASLLTSVHVGLIMDESQGVMGRFAELLDERRDSFKELQSNFEPTTTFNIKNIRSRINI